MAGLEFTATSGYVSLSTSEKTCIQIKAPSSQGVWLKGTRVTGGQAAGGTDAAVKMRQTLSTANFGTSGSTATTGPTNDWMSQSVNSTCGANFSAEPTSPTDLGDYTYFNPEAGYEILWPRSEWRFIKPGSARNISLTAVSGTPSVAVTATCEE